MRKGVFVIVIMVVFLSIFISGCEEEVEDLCAQTEALPISVKVKPNFLYYPLAEKAMITCVMNSIKCGSGGGDYVDFKQDVSSGSIASFDGYSFNLNNRVDAVWVEGSMVAESGNFSLFDEAILDYDMLKTYDGGTYIVYLTMGKDILAQYDFTLSLSATVNVYQTNNNKPLNNTTVNLEIISNENSISYTKYTNEEGVIFFQSTKLILKPGDVVTVTASALEYYKVSKSTTVSYEQAFYESRENPAPLNYMELTFSLYV